MSTPTPRQLKHAGFLVGLLVLLLAGGPLRAQTSLHRYWAASPDSLRRVLATQHADTARLRTLLHLLDCSLYETESAMPDIATVVALTKHLRRPEYCAYRLLLAGVQAKGEPSLDSLQAAVTAFDQLHQPAAWPLIYLREVFSALNREDARLAYYQTKRAQYLRSGDTISLAVCHHALGGSYTYRGDYNQATSQYLRAAELGRSASQQLYHTLLLSVASSYRKWGNYAKALKYLRLGEPGLTSVSARASVFQARGFIYLRQRDYPAALRAADQALLTAVFAGPGPAPAAILRARAYALLLKSQVLLTLGRVGEAGLLLQQAQSLADSLRLPLVSTAAPFELDATWARYYQARREPARAETYWLTAYRKARESLSTPLRLAYLRALTRFYQPRQPAKAASYAIAVLALADSLEAREGTLHVASYEIEQADRAQTSRIAGLRQAQVQEAARARRQRWVLGAVLTVLALIGGFSFLLWRSNRRQQRANALLSQQKAEIQAQRDQLNTSLTSLRATQAQLIQAEKMASLGELTAGIAHEIQNPLNFVNNFSEVSAELVEELKAAQAAGDAAEATALADDLMQNLGKIHHHGRRAARIVRGMLEHSRAGAGERAPTDVNALADEYLRLAYQGLRARDKTFNAALQTDFAPDLPLVEVAAGDLGRVLLNLFSNAFYAVRQRQQAGEPGYAPTVRVATTRAGDAVELRVSDNGTGISPEVQAKIFQPFFTTKPTGEGTGLGLSLSYDIITQGHGGTLRVQSRPGHSTEFLLTLPR
ncbi:ATP-binding protein [Hymenobacter sp. PAMC 26628]|uniref:ATP-binding protein n=1 Tax=Hymenobacter sp. PAMC 26628 TaxID=1484118 RepID=UPI0007701F57|nr:ATP-binding protein [Hymenobacter sp. PAMC 26628]AMJ67213.1 hypothetical protein AXW84_18580 [Hymenobacter sp. PAMC 26628]